MTRTLVSEPKLGSILDGQFSWQQFWAYFNSELCSDEMRVTIIQNINIVACITGAMPKVQIEILEHAPQVLINHPSVVEKLTPQAKKELLKEEVVEDEEFFFMFLSDERKLRKHIRDTCVYRDGGWYGK